MHHDPERPTVREVMPDVEALYNKEDGYRCRPHDSGSVGGHLHIVLDDGNVETGMVESCIERAKEDGCMVCLSIARKILLMSPTQRKRLYQEHNR